MADAHKNFAVSLVATAPSPATSGTSLVVTAAEGARFPAVPFNLTISPANTLPTPANSEIVRVTARSTDTLTITRAQEGTTARTVVVGDQVAATVTALTLTDAEVPVGVIHQYAAAAAPTGYLLCDGTAVSRTTYAALFAVTSTLYGVGDGSTTFNLPDFRGRVPVGYAASGGHADAATLGNNDGVAVANRRPKHNHTFTQPTISSPSITVVQPTISQPAVNITDPTHNHATNAVQSPGGANVNGGFGFGPPASAASNTAASTGITAALSGAPVATGGTATLASAPVATLGAAGVGGTAAVDAPAYLVVNYIIKT